MGVKFFRKNYLDLDYPAVLSVTDAIALNDGADFLDFLRNRNNLSGWMTTGTTDAANTTIDGDLGSTKEVDYILLLKHNFKNYTLQYLDPNTLVYTDFSTAINVTNNTVATTSHTFTKVSFRYFRLVITATMVVNAEKSMTQLIVTELLGDLAVKPELDPMIDKTRKATKYLSGKMHIARSVPSFEVKLTKENIKSDDDLSIFETLYDSYEGFLVWLCGGSEADFVDGVRQGYRLEDIFLMNMQTEYRPRYNEGYYKHGITINTTLVEIV